jgi:hypothetical protein
LDCRPHGPEPCALAELSHAPKADIISFRYPADKAVNPPPNPCARPKIIGSIGLKKARGAQIHYVLSAPSEAMNSRKRQKGFWPLELFFGCRAGRRMQNRLPLPSTLSTSTLP